MAVVTTALLASQTRTVFETPPDMPRSFGPIPRALLNFQLNSAVLDAKPVNDQQTLTVSFNLPVNFAYQLLDGTITIDQDVAANWDANPHLEVLNAIRGMPNGVVNRHPWILVASHRAAVAPVALCTPRAPRQPTYIMQRIRAGVSPSTLFRASNVQDAVGAAGLVFAFFSFLEFDIEQVQRFPVHYPVQTYAR